MQGQRYRVLYDEQCEICQAGATWLRVLDKKGSLDLVAIDPSTLEQDFCDLCLDDCLRELHVVTPAGEAVVGWDAVALLARRFPATWVIGAVGGWGPGRWAGRVLYRYIAANRYWLSKCRGGHCHVASLHQVRAKAPARAFWSCWFTGMVLRIPLITFAAARDQWQRLVTFLRTRRRRFDLLSGKLSIMFLGGGLSDLVPIFFGEQFSAILYDGVLVDPGSTRMRRSLAKHLEQLPRRTIHSVAATHHHEEHVGNINWAADRLGTKVYASEATSNLLVKTFRLPWIREILIGQPPPLRDALLLHPGDRLRTTSGELHVYAAPGHSDDHIVFYDPIEKLLLAGDAFMGGYFSTPNPDVDSRVWIDTLEQLVALDVEILVEGHGHIHTMRPDIPEVAGLVVREHPREALEQKLHYLRWVRGQVEAGIAEGLPLGAIEATCFPWGQSWAWERFVSDEMTRLFSSGHFSRSELIRSFVRHDGDKEALPVLYEIRSYRSKK